MKLRHALLILLLVLLLAVGAVAMAAQARPATPTVAPAYLEWGMPHGATAKLECGNGFFQVVTQTVSLVEVSCQPWVLEPAGE